MSADASAAAAETAATTTTDNTTETADPATTNGSETNTATNNGGGDAAPVATSEPVIPTNPLGVQPVRPAPDADTIKLFLGQLPRTFNESEVEEIMKDYGEISDCVILRDRGTGVSKGCGFVTFVKRSSAMAAMEGLHDKKLLPTMSRPMQVKPSDSEARRGEEKKLFVAMLARTATEEQLQSYFAPHGNVEEISILRNADGTSKGCAFVNMGSKNEAQQAILQLHNSFTMPGCRAPIIVKFADTEEEKQRKRQMRGGFMQQPAYGSPMMRPPMYGGGMPAYGAAPYGGAPQYGAAPPAPYGGAPAAPDMMGQPYGGAPMYGAPGGFQHQPYQQNAYGGPQAVASTQREGPPNCNLFIYHIPPEFNDHALQTTFGPFGTVVSAKVFVDKMTQQSKGFGFVSYDNPHSANAAIQAMNGFQIGGKRLKVQLKRPKGAPY